MMTYSWTIRLSSAGPRRPEVIDIALLRTEPDLVRHICQANGCDVDKLISLDSELRRVGNPVPADAARGHDAIGTRLGIFDMACGAEVAGSGFYYWKGDGARLAWAMFSYTQDFLVGRGSAGK